MFGSILSKPWYEDFLCNIEDDDGKGKGKGKGKPDPDEDDDDDDDDDAKGKGKTFTQAQVNQIGSREKKEGRRAAIRELLEELEIEDEDALKDLVKKTRKAEDEAKDEITRNQEKAQKEKDEAEAAKKEAAKDRRLAKVERMLGRAGVPDEKIARALKNLEFDVDNDIDEEEVTSAIEELKGDLPTLFEENEDTDAGEGGGARPPAKPAPKGRQVKETVSDKARAALLDMHPELAKKD